MKEEKNDVRVALAGIGAIGRQYAVMIGSGQVPGMKLTAVCARSRESHRWAHENLGDILVCSGADDLFSHGDAFDALIVATPHSSHLEYTCLAIEAGKHVLCDKPAGISVREARIMKEAYDKRDEKLFGMMFHRRTYNQFHGLKELIVSGRLGTLKRMSMKDVTSFRTVYYHKSCSWRSSWNGENGGMLINQGQHALDMWQWLFGMPDAVYASIPFGKYNDFQVDDEVTMVMDYANGVTGSFFMTTGEPVGEDVIEVVGTRGKAVLTGSHLASCFYQKDLEEYTGHVQVTSNQELSCSWEETDFEPMGGDEPYLNMFRNFADAVRNGEKLVARGTEGTRAMELANAAYLSAWKGEKVSLPLDAQEYEGYLAAARKREKTDRGLE